MPAGDTDANGTWDSTDYANMTGSYDVRKDANQDGVVDASDATWANAVTGSYQTLGWGVPSSTAVNNRKAYAGYAFADELQASGSKMLVRNRFYDADTGRWSRRDPLGYIDGVNLYEYVRDRPVRFQDPSGTAHQEGGGCDSGTCSGHHANSCLAWPISGTIPSGCTSDERIEIYRRACRGNQPYYVQSCGSPCPCFANPTNCYPIAQQVTVSGICGPPRADVDIDDWIDHYSYKITYQVYSVVCDFSGSCYLPGTRPPWWPAPGRAEPVP